LLTLAHGSVVDARSTCTSRRGRASSSRTSKDSTDRALSDVSPSPRSLCPKGEYPSLARRRSKVHRDLVWTLRQPDRQLTRRFRSRPHKHTGTHDTVERSLKLIVLTDARSACPAGVGSNLPVWCGVQATSRRRPSSAASRPTKSRLRCAHRPETRSSRRLRTARCSTSGPTLAHTDTPRRT
jgi:hypothetical protein